MATANTIMERKSRVYAECRLYRDCGTVEMTVGKDTFVFEFDTAFIRPSDGAS